MPKKPTQMLSLPKGVSAGAAIGAGGCNVRLIGLRHNVRCVVNPPQREIAFLGAQEDVANAVGDFHELFQRLLDGSAESTQHEPRNIAGQAFIHLRLVPAGKMWRFARRDRDSLKADKHTNHYEYVLVREGEAKSPTSDFNFGKAWLKPFDASFCNHMSGDLERIGANTFQQIRLKVSIGVTCFALRDQALVPRVFSLNQLLSLHLVEQIQPRWSTVWPENSHEISSLLRTLIGRAEEQAASMRTTMTVYVGTRHAKNNADDVVKYRLENNTWVLSQTPRLLRCVLAQYDVGVDDSTGLRVRAYSLLEGISLHEHLQVSPSASGSHFLSTASALPSMPSNRFVRGYTVKDKIHVDYQGLRFMISYFNKRHTRVSIECRLLDPVEAKQSPASEGAILFAKVLKVVQSAKSLRLAAFAEKKQEE